jgi:hypothetical protein
MQAIQSHKTELSNTCKKIKLISLKNKNQYHLDKTSFLKQRYFDSSFNEKQLSISKEKVLIQKFEKEKLKQRFLNRNHKKHNFPMLLDSNYSNNKTKSCIPQNFTITTSSHHKSKSQKQDTYSQTLTYFPSISHSTSKSKTRNHNNSTNYCFFAKQQMLTDTNEKLSNVENNCSNIHNEINIIKKPIDDKSKVYVIEKIDDIINNEIKQFVRDEPNVSEVSFKSQLMIGKSVYASKMNAKFAHDAEKVIYEIFNKDYMKKKKEMEELNKRRKNMKKKRLILRMKTDDLLQNYNSTILRCYETLNCK